jgi:lysophospholipase L1-like esterase
VPPDTGRGSEPLGELPQRNEPSGRGSAVLGFGDSITLGPEEGAFGVAPRAWAHWLAELLDVPFHRLARAGAWTPEMADTLLPRARFPYTLACVHVGTNDVRSVEWAPGSFAAALERILDGVGARAERVCVATIPLDLGRPRAGAKVAELNAIVRRAAAERGAVVVALDDLRGWRELFPDAVHPTALGQLEIARRAAAALGLAGDPAALTDLERGPGADVRYAIGRQVGHLLRDWRRRQGERNVRA